jgi:hypothetical protein
VVPHQDTVGWNQVTEAVMIIAEEIMENQQQTQGAAVEPERKEK